MSEQTSGAVRFGCPSCGGGLRYDIKTRTLVCGMCARHIKPLRLYDENLADGGGRMEVTAYQCPQCGALLASGSTEMTGFCTFCGSDVVLTQRTAQMQRPDQIVPFSVTREQCEEAYRAYLRHYHFAPSALRKQETVSHFRPVYIPFWAYDVTIEGRQRFLIRKTRSSVEETRDVEVDLNYTHRDILFDASEAFEDETAARLAHSLKEAVPFHAAYLSGMYAQMPDVTSDVYENEAKAGAMLSCTKKVMRELACSEVRYADRDQTANGAVADAKAEARLVLLPVWLLARRSGDRVLYTAVNGADGRVICDPPVSPVRAGILTAAVAAVLFALLYLWGTMAMHDLMLVTAAVMLLTMRLMVPVYRERLFRERREAEPDFTGETPYVGGVQTKLRQSQGVDAHGVMRKKGEGLQIPKALASMLYLALRLGLRALLTFGLIGVITLITEAAFELAAVIVGAFWIMSVIRSVRMAIRLPDRAEESVFLSGVAAVHLLIAGMVILSIVQPARDLIYYVIVAASLLLTAGIQALMIVRQNRFATRPVPYFGEEGER